MAASQNFSSIADGITDMQGQAPTAPDPPASTSTNDPAVPEAENPAPPRKRGRPKGSKNKTTKLVEFDASPPEKRPVGRPKKKLATSEPDAARVKRPVGRPRKDGLPAGSPEKTAPNSILPPLPNYYRITSTNAPVHQWVPAFQGSASAPPAPSQSAPVTAPHSDRHEWAELARTKPDEFLLVLLGALETPHPVSLTGPSIEEAFKSHLNSLAPTGVPQSQSQLIPSLYSILKTFWLPSSPSYFALTASASTVRTPSEHRFLYWDPQPLVFNGLACPSCAAPLANRGRIRSGPIIVHDLDSPFFIIGCEYACPANHTFASTDSSVLRALPAALQREFPARLVQGDAGCGADVWNWKARGVSRAMWNLMAGGLRAGLERQVLLQLVRDIRQGVPESVESVEPEANDERMEEEESAEEEEEPTEKADMSDVVMEPAVPESVSAQGAAGGTEPFPAPVPRQSSAEAFNNAWTANSVVNGGSTGQGTSGSGTAPQSDVAQSATPSSMPQGALPMAMPQGAGLVDMRNNPYASLAYPMFPLAHGALPMVDATGANGPAIIAYAASLKRAYPFPADADPIGNGEHNGAGSSSMNGGGGESSNNASNNASSGSSSGVVGSKPRNPRHCCKCGSQTCKGKGGRTFCTSPCMDCGQFECRGRNSRRPNSRCDAGMAYPAWAATAGRDWGWGRCRCRCRVIGVPFFWVLSD
ncbi:hypothetical protein C8J57DRAFT_692488 [Mycena rebaudengoi]|nr:hypothetical protein C8J57DRAFT_692488 [Mycena rebaudengoi]